MKKTVVAGSLVLDILPVFPHAVTSDSCWQRER